MKIDKSLIWDWKEVFWTYWVFFSILVGVNFGLFLMTSSKFCQGLFSEIDVYECKKALLKNKLYCNKKNIIYDKKILKTV